MGEPAIVPLLAGLDVIGHSTSTKVDDTVRVAEMVLASPRVPAASRNSAQDELSRAGLMPLLSTA